MFLTLPELQNNKNEQFFPNQLQLQGFLLILCNWFRGAADPPLESHFFYSNLGCLSVLSMISSYISYFYVFLNNLGFLGRPQHDFFDEEIIKRSCRPKRHQKLSDQRSLGYIPFFLIPSQILFRYLLDTFQMMFRYLLDIVQIHFRYLVDTFQMPFRYLQLPFSFLQLPLASFQLPLLQLPFGFLSFLQLPLSFL